MQDPYSRTTRAFETRLWTATESFVGRFAWVGVYFFILLAFGTFGYVWFEGWEWMDSLYMAAITATAVGYGEVHPLSNAGRLFTMILMAGSVIGLGMVWALTTAMVVELDLRGLLRRRRMMRKIQDLSDHFIVCGAGRMGRVVIREIQRSGIPFVVIESKEDQLSQLLGESPGVLFVEGDATKEQTLLAAGIEDARGVAACLPGDADNILLCLTIRGLKPDVEIVARAYDEESLAKLRRAGASRAISPTMTGAVRMASSLLRPSVVSFLDEVTVTSGMTLRLEETEIPASSPLAGQTLADAKIPQRTGLIVLALRSFSGDGGATYNPGPETRLSTGDVMIVLGSPEQTQSLRDYVGSE